MWRWATIIRNAGYLLAAAVAAAGDGHDAFGKILIPLDDALKLTFPGCPVQRETFYLTPEQAKAAATAASGEVDSSLVVRYQAGCKTAAGVAYTDTHRVRTQVESLLVVLNADRSVRKIEILSFNEPPEYVPKPKWYEQFQNQHLSDDLQIRKGISPVTGASLTARATTQAVRRVLALDAVLSAIAKPAAAPTPAESKGKKP